MNFNIKITILILFIILLLLISKKIKKITENYFQSKTDSLVYDCKFYEKRPDLCGKFDCDNGNCPPNINFNSSSCPNCLESIKEIASPITNLKLKQTNTKKIGINNLKKSLKNINNDYKVDHMYESVENIHFITIKFLQNIYNLNFLNKFGYHNDDTTKQNYSGIDKLMYQSSGNFAFFLIYCPDINNKIHDNFQENSQISNIFENPNIYKFNDPRYKFCNNNTDSLNKDIRFIFIYQGQTKNGYPFYKNKFNNKFIYYFDTYFDCWILIFDYKNIFDKNLLEKNYGENNEKYILFINNKFKFKDPQESSDNKLTLKMYKSNICPKFGISNDTEQIEIDIIIEKQNKEKFSNKKKSNIENFQVLNKKLGIEVEWNDQKDEEDDKNLKIDLQNLRINQPDYRLNFDNIDTKNSRLCNYVHSIDYTSPDGENQSFCIKKCIKQQYCSPENCFQICGMCNDDINCPWNKDKFITEKVAKDCLYEPQGENEQHCINLCKRGPIHSDDIIVETKKNEIGYNFCKENDFQKCKNICKKKTKKNPKGCDNIKKCPWLIDPQKTDYKNLKPLKPKLYAYKYNDILQIQFNNTFPKESNLNFYNLISIIYYEKGKIDKKVVLKIPFNEMNKNNLFLSDDNKMFFYEFDNLKENTVYNFYVILSNIFGKCKSSNKVEVNLGEIKKKTSFGISDFKYFDENTRLITKSTFNKLNYKDEIIKSNKNLQKYNFLNKLKGKNINISLS